MIRKQYSKLILQEIYLAIQIQKQLYFSLLKKQRKLFWIFHKEL